MRGHRIGPYRLESRIGMGGTGEVFRARDERLDRWVAVKRVRHDRQEEPTRRERHRREARMVANLHHPAIVSIYDVIQTEEDEWIVMEFLEGRTLAKILADGPLEPDRVLRVGRVIADSLVEAHDKGIIHRDLKVENVMITPEWRIKVLDFGLAKNLLRLESEESLTVDGAIEGTIRAMSPEQASGLEVDHRTDLFSLGVLLYECATGVSPFRAPTVVETVSRICRHQQQPVTERNPALSPELGALIDRLLEKDPARRPHDAREVAAALDQISEGDEPPSQVERRAEVQTLAHMVEETTETSQKPVTAPAPEASRRFRLGSRARLALAVAAALVLVTLVTSTGQWWHGGAEPDLISVAVLPASFENQSGPGHRAAARALELSLVHSLYGMRGLAVAQTPDHDAPWRTSMETAHRAAADEVLVSSLDCFEETCAFTIERVRGAYGGVAFEERIVAPANAVQELAGEVQATLRRAFPAHRLRPGAEPLEVTQDDLERYLELERCWEDRCPEHDLPALARELDTVRSSSPRFVEAQLLAVEVARSLASEQPQQADRALELASDAAEEAAHDPRPLRLLFDLALEHGRDELAEEALGRLLRRFPDDPRTLARRARLAEHQGKRSEALAVMHAAAVARPSRWLLLELARMEERFGDAVAARIIATDLLRRFPQDPDALALLGPPEPGVLD